MAAADELLAQAREAFHAWGEAARFSEAERIAACEMLASFAALDRLLIAGKIPPPAAWQASPTTTQPTYSLAEIRDGTGWPEGARFVLYNRPNDCGHCCGCDATCRCPGPNCNAPAEPERTYTRDQVQAYVVDGAALVQEGLELCERETDVVNLAVNAAMSLIDAADPDAVTLDQVMDENYEGGAAKVRTWWGGWS